MYYSKVDGESFIVRLEKGEKVIDSITKLCEKRWISNAWFIAIGSVENPIVAHYKVDTKKYCEKKLDGIYEVTSLTGTVGLFEGKPLVHGHISLSDENMNAFGGHLVEADVSATLEVIIKNLGSGKTKKYNDEIGLKLFELDEKG